MTTTEPVWILQPILVFTLIDLLCSTEVLFSSRSGLVFEVFLLLLLFIPLSVNDGQERRKQADDMLNLFFQQLKRLLWFC